MDNKRYDTATLRSFVRTDEGYLLAEGYASRPGILEYANPDGTVRRELVPRDELSKVDSLTTLARKPVTLNHPEDFVTPDNVTDVQVGDVAETIELDELNGFVKIRMAVRKADAIEAVLLEGIRELSVGYTVDLEMTPGEDPEFGHYDAIQRNRRYNHVAIVPAGRAGSAVGLRVDDKDSESVQDRLDRIEAKLDALVLNDTDINPVPEQNLDSQSPKMLSEIKADFDDFLERFNQRAEALKYARLAGIEINDTAPTEDIRRDVAQKILGRLERTDEAFVAAAFMLVRQRLDEVADNQHLKFLSNPPEPVNKLDAKRALYNLYQRGE